MRKLFNIGNASEIGTRPGEKVIERTTDHKSTEFGASILRKHPNQDMHMKIIRQHRVEEIREKLFKRLKDLVAQSKQKRKCFTG